MKKLLIIVGAVVVLFIAFYMINNEDETANNPTLNETAMLPDQYLRNVAFFEENEKHNMSAFSLEKAIESIWNLEADVDEQSFRKLEVAVRRLEKIHRGILMDSLEKEDMKAAFEFSLNNLAHAELEIAEMYAETNQLEMANIALKYAKLHIKNAMLYHDQLWGTDSIQLAIEKQVFEEMDSLLNNKLISNVEYTMSLDKMIKEVDKVIASQKIN